MRLEDKTARLVRIFSKIPMFEGLSANRALAILKICTLRSVTKHEVLCEAGSKETEMFILVSGRLNVVGKDDVPLASLTPITTVGEMGLLTGAPRTATVVAAENSTVFEISRLKFEVMVKKDPEIGFRIYRNLVHTLSERLTSTSNDLAEAQRRLSTYEEPALVA